MTHEEDLNEELDELRKINITRCTICKTLINLPLDMCDRCSYPYYQLIDKDLGVLHEGRNLKALENIREIYVLSLLQQLVIETETKLNTEEILSDLAEFKERIVIIEKR